MSTVLPGLGKLIRRSWCLIFAPWSNDALIMARHRGEEIGGGLLFWADEAKAFEVGLRLAGLAEKYLPSLVENKDFVENLHPC